MIEDEDNEEEILKKGITFKSALKNIFIIIIIMLGAYFMYLGFSPNQWFYIIIGISLLCIGTTIMQVQKELPEPLRQTLTILSCVLCGLIKVRNYETGDFIFNKTSENCDKCSGKFEVKQIYSVKLKKPTTVETKKKEESKKKPD